MTTDDNKSKLWQAAAELLGSSGRQAVIRVEGASMAPTFPPDTRILVDFAARSPSMGDIILFHQAGSLVVHRFLARIDSRRHGPCLRTRGDGIQALDPPLADLDLLGRVIACRRSGTWYRLDRAGARFWGVLAAIHDHLWAAVGVSVGRLRPVAWFLDRTGLRLGDRVLFRLLHRTMKPPDLAEIDLSAEGML